MIFDKLNLLAYIKPRLCNKSPLQKNNTLTKFSFSKIYTHNGYGYCSVKFFSSLTFFFYYFFSFQHLLLNLGKKI
jgi:hypothetical protein